MWRNDLSFGDLIWAGSVDNVTDSDDGLHIECRGPLAKLDQAFPCLVVAATCTLETYSDQCGLVRGLWATAGTIGAITRNAVTVTAAASKADGYFSHGYAECNGIRIGIEMHTGSVIQTTYPPTLWQVGDAITLFAGDDHPLETCRTRFLNEANFLGVGIGMPSLNPVTQVIG